MENKSLLKVIKRRNQFSAIKKDGERFFAGRWLIINYLSIKDFDKNSGSKNLEFGWTISKKIGKAVTRNKLKRWCREYFRDYLEKHSPPISANINIVLRVIDKNFYESIRHEDFLKNLNKGWIKVVKKMEHS